MILKTITDELGNTEIRISDSFKGLFNGDFFKEQNLLSDSDIKAIKAYNAEIDACTTSQAAFNRTMLNASKQAQNIVAAANGNTVALEGMTKASKAAELGMKALSVAGNALLAWGLSEVVNVVYNLATASDRLAESAAQMGSEFASTKSEISDYKTKIEELYETINDDTSSYEDTYNARQELLSIQNEMIEKFGDEATAVDLVTDAINGQTNALDTLTEKQWQETVNSYNSNNGKSFGAKVVDNLKNIVHGSNFQRMIDEMEDSKITFHMLPMVGDETYDEFIKKLKEDFGATITRTDRDNAITLSGDLNTVYQELLNIQTLAQGMGIDDSLLQNLGEQADKTKSKLEEYQEMYSQHILYDKIFVDAKTLNEAGKTYEESFDEINKAYEEYQDAFASGDEDAIEQAKQNYAEIVQGAIEGLDDQSVIDYFNNMYPDLQEVVGGWEFEVKFKAAVEDDNDDFEKEVQDAASKFGTVEDIQNYNPKVATEEQKEAYLTLEQYADEYGLTLDQLIEKLEEMGLLQSQSKADLLDKLIPSKSTPTAGVSAVFTDIIDGVDADEVEKWVDSLTDEEVKLANSPEFDAALEKQKEKINSIRESLKEAQENLENEYQKISDLGLDDYADQIKNGTIQTKFGNVDMDKRTIIHWSDELKQTYADALASWDYDPKVGTIDTVFGMSDRFGEDLTDEGWEIAFTPILPDGTFLSRDTVEEYIDSILAEAYADDQKVTEDELTAIDAQGRQIGNTFVQGIFAGIDDSQNYDDNGNWANVIGTLMHFVGNFGAIKLANDGIDKASESMDAGTLSVENYAAALQDVKDAQADTSNETPIFSLTTEQSTAIDNFQTKINTLSSALSSLRTDGKLDGDTLTDLMQEFPSLAEESGDLEDAIESLIIDALEELYNTLGKNLPNKYKNSLKEIADEALNTQKTVKESFSNIQNSYDVMYEFKEAMSDDKITDSLLNSVAGLSDSLNTLVAGFYAGLVSADELFSAITEHYNTDLQNYSNALIEKNALGSEFYSNVGLSSTEVINHFRDNYGVDIENCKSYAALKAKIEMETLGKISRKWSEYYDIQTQQLNEKAKYLQNQADHLSGNAKMKFYSDHPEFFEMLNELKKESARYQEMMDYINNITYEGIEGIGLSFDKISTKIKKASDTSSSSSKSSTTEIDWIQRKVDVLSDSLDDLKTKLEAATTTDQKRTILDQEIEKAEELKAVYVEAAKKYKEIADSYAKANSSILTDSVLTKIKGGAKVSDLGVEELSRDEADIVNKYKDLWDNYKEFKSLQAEINNDIADYEEEKRQTVIDDFSEEYDLLKHNLEMNYITEKEYYDSLQELNEKYYSDKEKFGDEYAQYEEEIYSGLQSYYKSYCDDMMDYYEKALESNKISFKKYCKEVVKLLKNMFKQGKISAEDYYTYLEQYYQNQKDIYDKVISAVEKRFDEEIDKIDDQIDEINDANDKLEEQKTLYENAASAVSDYYQTIIDGINDENDALEDANDKIQEQIDKYDSLISVADRLYEEEQDRLEDQKDAIQDKIDFINDENDAIDLQYRKEQALYELERSQQQRTKKVYVGDKGFIYDTDQSAISDAKKNVEDIRTEELINSLEKEQDALDDAIEALQKYRDALSDISDAYNKLVDERNAIELIGENYKDTIFGTKIEDWDKLKDKYISINDELANNEKLIESNNEKIEQYDKLKEEWDSLSNVLSDITNRQAAIELFGADYEKQLNEGRIMSFEQFKNKYVQLDNKINDNQDLITSLEEKKTNYESLKEQWSNLTSAYEDEINAQYAAAILGKDWESDIFDERLTKIGSFKKKYIEVQEEITTAGEKAAEAALASLTEASEATEKAEKKKEKAEKAAKAAEEKAKKAQEEAKKAEAAKKKAEEEAAAAATAAAKAASDAAAAASSAAAAAASANTNKATTTNTTNTNKTTTTNTNKTTTTTTNKTTTKTTGTSKVSGISKSSIASNQFKAYAEGTRNAPRGINLVGEDGIETYADNHGNVAIVTEPTLIPMEGGETVYNNDETNKMLSMEGLMPVDFIGGMKVADVAKQFGNMAFNMPTFGNTGITKPNVGNVSNMQSVVIGDIHLHEVQNVSDFGKALKEALPGISVQFNGRH